MQASSDHGGLGTPGREGRQGTGGENGRYWDPGLLAEESLASGILGRELDTCQVRAEWQIYTWMEGAVTVSEVSRPMLSNVGVLPPW